MDNALILTLICCMAGGVTLNDVPSEFTLGVNLARDNGQHATLIQLAVDYINSNPDVLPNTTLKTVVNVTDGLLETLQYIQHQCYQLDQGVQVIIGPETSDAVIATYPVLAGLSVPQVAPYATDDSLSFNENDYPFLLKMSPPDKFQITALADLAEHFSWTRLAVLASYNHYGRNGASMFVSTAISREWPVPLVRYFSPSSDMNMTEIQQSLQDIRENGINIILLFCISQFAGVIMSKAEAMEMTTSEFAWLVPDGITNVEGFFDPCLPAPEHLVGVFGTTSSEPEGSLYPLIQSQFSKYQKASPNTIQECSQDDWVSTEMFDAVLAVAYALHNFLQDGHTIRQPQPHSNVCYSSEGAAKWPDGKMFTHYLQQVAGPGTEHYMNFTSVRTPYFRKFDIVNLQENGWTKVGSWSEQKENSLSLDPDANILFQGEGAEPPGGAINLRNMKLEVVGILETPFLMRREDDTGYEGYCFDLLKELQSRLGFQYNLHLSYDGQYGGLVLDDKTNVTTYNGMVGEVIRQEADMTLAPLTISYQRQTMVDFSTPFKLLGLTFILAKQSSSNDFFAFLSPFQNYLWIAVLATFIVTSVAITCCSYLSPYGPHGKYIQRLDRADGRQSSSRKVFKLQNAVWQSFGAWMMQGQDTSPTFLSGRIVTSCWWITVMVVSATYTANLAAFLTVAKFESDIESVEDLAQQTAVPYGTVLGGGAEELLKTSDSDTFKSMYSYMKIYDTSVRSAKEGIARVIDGYGQKKSKQYGFIYDSALLEYAAASKEPCVIKVVGKLFNQFGYGLAFRKDSPLTEVFSLEILKMKQEGFMDKLDLEWFSGKCTAIEDTSTNTIGDQATLESMRGIFALFLCGLLLAFVVVMLECCSASLQDVQKTRERTRWSEEGNTHGPNNICSALRRRIYLVGNDFMHIIFSSEEDEVQISDEAKQKEDTNYSFDSGFKTLDTKSLVCNKI